MMSFAITRDPVLSTSHSGEVAEKRPCLLGVSPISVYVVHAALRAAKDNSAPILFVASLNQVDVDGGYTGWTPELFVSYVSEEADKLGFQKECGVVFELDHGGPWLKDEHIVKNYSYMEAVDSFLKSLEAFIRSGFTLVHIDATLDLERPGGVAELSTAAVRTAELIAYSEEIARECDAKLSYEIGSDRWGYKSPEQLSDFITRVFLELKKRGLNPGKVVFGVADVGTKVEPGNRVDPFVVKAFSEVVQSHGLRLKIHSGDFLENPEVLPQTSAGGVNIGPMFAHTMYSTVKEVLQRHHDAVAAERLLRELNTLIVSGDKLKKYTAGEAEEYKLGIASRYIWSTRNAETLLSRVSDETGVDVRKLIVDRIYGEISSYIQKLGLQGLLTHMVNLK
ncbi:MAG: class II D-tagatose-bisphosphate aldolase, non-catalytic subunit [Thermofilum sp.]